MRFPKFIACSLLVFVFLLVACEKPQGVSEPAAAPPLVSAYFYVNDDAGLFDAPFPIEHMRRADGTIRFDRMSNEDNAFLGAMYISQANEMTIGFSRNAAVFFRFDGAIAPDNLPPAWADSLQPDSTVFLVNIETGSAHYGERVPITAYWQPDMDGYHQRFLLALLPFQGVALAEGELYAAVVLRALGDLNGRPLAVNPTFAAALQGQWASGDFTALDAPAFAKLSTFLNDTGIDPETIAVATAFRTAQPVKQMVALRNTVNALADPEATFITMIAEYADYYVIEGWFRMPIFQDGSPVYWTSGGRIHFDANGNPILVWWQKVRFAVSIPKSTMPAGGWPLLFYSPGQGGSYTEIFDRSPTSAHDPGEGPGKLFAQRGISCLGIEAPLTGPRHPLNSATGIEFHNPYNLAAFTDNVRQAAVEYTYLIKLARILQLDPTLAPLADPGGASAFTFDPSQFFFWGHGTGAAIGHLVLAVEPGFRAGMLSGGGASTIDDLIDGQKPEPYGVILKWLLGAHDFNAYHPLTTLFETATDTSEAANFDPHWIGAPLASATSKDVLLIAGDPDSAVPAERITAMEIAAGVDLAGDEIIPDTIATLQALSGRGQVSLPAEGNLTVAGQRFTGVVLQYQAAGSADGHFVAFEQNAPRYQYTCFFRNIVATGHAIVPAPNNDVSAPCE